MTPSGTEPATFRFVAQHLNHCATAFQTVAVQKIKTHFMFSNILFKKLCHLWDNVQKYFRARQATDDSMAYAQSMLDT